ncbi:MAG: hypothetical protein RLZZ204_1085 [Bacteroidota bacterium]|jgi:hypothetical protein
MKNILVLVFVLVAFNGIAQDKVIFNDEHVVLRDVQDFQSVVVRGPFKVYYSSDAETQVAVSAKDNDARDRITTKVSGGTLYVSLDNSGTKWWGVNKEFKVYITAPKLNALNVSGAVNFVVVDILKSTNLSLILSGASNFSGKIDAEEIKANLSGASDCKVSGSANKLGLVCSGASSFKGSDLKVDEADLDASGASSIKVHVIESLKAHASGASSIQYKGAPKMYNQSASGASSIKQMN